MEGTYQASDVVVLPSAIPIPEAGYLTVNAFLLQSEEPVLFDTGLGVDGPAFIEAVSQHVPLDDLRWIWLTHDDADHTGNIAKLMELAPKARLATNAFSAMRMSTWWDVPLDRVYALTVGDRLDVGDRSLRVVRPPTFDNPMSIGALDESTGSLFSVDAFGAILPEVTEDAWNIPEEALLGGMIAWGTLDSPWAHLVQTDRFDAVLDEVRRLEPARVFSSHLPAAHKGIDTFLDTIAGLRDADPFVAPNNEQFQQLLAAMSPQ